MTSVAALASLLPFRTWETLAAASPQPDGTGGLASLSEASFREVVLEALLARNASPRGGGAALPGAGETPLASSQTAQPSAESASGRQPTGVLQEGEREVILREAQRTGVDPSLLVALRRVENGGPGREFGVLAVPARGLEAQAHVAANTVQRTMAPFERQGKGAVDPTTGRYTEGFLRFLSARYAPVGAANDPMGLNRFHGDNLVALYRKASQGGEG